MTALVLLALLGATPAKKAAPKAPPKTEAKPEVKAEPAPEPAPEAKVEDAWEFDGERAHVIAHGESKDDVTSMALSQLGVKLDGDAYFKVSAHANSTGGVTLKLADYNDEKSSCDLYTTREGDTLKFADARCSFPAFTGSARTSATCRKITGTAKRLGRAVALEATSPDCTAQPMGFSMSGRANVKPFPEDKK